MTTDLVLFGTGSFAEVAAHYLDVDSDYEVVGFTVDGDYVDSDTFLGRPLIPFEEIEQEFPPESHEMMVTVGYRDQNALRAKKYEEGQKKGYDFGTYANSRLSNWGKVEIGENCFIFEDQTIQPFVEIGDNVVLWSGNHIGHHSTVGDNCFVTSQAVISGQVTVRENCFIGVNASIADGVTVAQNCTLGAGTVLLEDTEPGGTYVGNPARRLENGNESGGDK